MKEPIVYTYIAKSVNGYMPSGVLNDLGATIGANNSDLTYYNIAALTQRILSESGCRICKLEIAGAYYINAASQGTGWGIAVYVPYSLRTTSNSTSSSAENYLATINPCRNTSFQRGSSFLAFNSPLYISNVESLVNIRILQKVGINQGISAAVNTPAYSIMFKLTPFFI